MVGDQYHHHPHLMSSQNCSHLNTVPIKIIYLFIYLLLLAHRTATQYDRLLASSCPPSVRPSVTLCIKIRYHAVVVVADILLHAVLSAVIAIAELLVIITIIIILYYVVAWWYSG